MKTIIVIILIVCPMLANAQTIGKDSGWPTPTCGSPFTTMYQLKRGGDLNPTCRRPTATLYIIDGVQLQVRTLQPEPMRPILDKDLPTSYRLNRKELNKLPYTNINDAVAMYPGIYQQRRGDAISVFGDRIGGAQYVVDGMQIMR